MVKIFHPETVRQCQAELARCAAEIQQEGGLSYVQAAHLAGSRAIRRFVRMKRVVYAEMLKYRVAREQDDLSEIDASLYLSWIRAGVRIIRRLDLKIRIIHQITGRAV